MPHDAIEVLRTPEERFDDLPDFGWPPAYLDDLPGFEGLRMHVLDAGPRDAERVFLCLHGEPTWCYLYRRMIPVFEGVGARVVAPDLFGFGRSDKPVDGAVYGFHFHRNALLALLDRLGLRRITLVCQDWGGLLGLTLPMERPDHFERILAMNTTLATGRPAGPGFEAWRAHAAANPDLDVGRLMRRATPILSEAEAAAYDAPFPGARHKAGVRRFPEMVMTRPDMEGVDVSLRAAAFLSQEWRGDALVFAGLQDPVFTLDAMRALAGAIRGCPEPVEVPQAGHFVQEWGEPVAREALRRWGGA